MLHIRNLNKHYGNKIVLNNVNLDFEANKIYGIVGHNGSGKTTFFKCLLGIEKYEGNIYNLSVPILKNVTGYLPTELFFFNRITAKEYLNFMLSARGIKIKDIDINKVNWFQLPLNDFCETYSTGMQKQLAFMAILLQNNAYYILDEPFNGLDLRSNLILKNKILALQQDNKTFFISSHILSSLTEICDAIYLIKNGEFQVFKKIDYFSLEQTLLDA